MRRILAIGVAVALAIFAAGILIWLNHGPRYEGRSAGYWVEQLLQENIKAREALRHIGPAAVPALADVVNRRRSGLWAQLAAWRQNLPSFVARRLPNHALDQLLQERAIEVLYEFGSAAAPAAPALIGVDANLNDMIGFGSAELAHATLLQIGPAGLPYFIQTLKGKSAKIRANAASYIGHLGPAAGAAAPALARTLKNDASPTVRSSAVIALGRIGPAAVAALPELKAALRLDDDYFRLAVIRALWTVGRDSETTVPILVKILSDRNNPNRAGAAMMLGEMGPPAAAAAPALADVLREEFSYTRVKAEEALKRIKAEPAEKDRKVNPNDE